MEPESRYTMIGAIVLGLIGLVIFSFAWLSGVTGSAEYRFYTIYFERQSLEGLQIGGDVNMRGIKVGQVESFEILRENINRVNVVIRIDADTPVSTNSVAVIDRNLLTSIADVNLETPGRPGPALTKVPKGERYPVIAEGTGELDAFAESASSLIVKADEALQNINHVLSEENRLMMRDILSGVRQVTQRLDERLESFDQTAVAFRLAAQEISKSLGGVSENVTPLTREARLALRDMREALKEVAAVARSMQDTTRTLAQRASNATRIGVTELRATAGELRTGVDVLVRTLDRLQDPRAALLGPGEGQLGPGETQ